jgi:opacity protein-like surface antigen
MKKVLLIVALLTISLASLTFAQATVGGWGRGVFVPVAVADGDVKALLQSSWGGPNRVGFSISGSSDNIGAQADMIYDGGAVAVGDQFKAWVKPIEMLTITIGQAFDDTLRGSEGFCAYNWVRPNGIVGDDLTFMRIGRTAGANVIVAAAPVDGAYVYAALGTVVPGWWDFSWGSYTMNLFNPDASIARADTMSLMLEEGQYGAGYDIAGIGVIRAQFLGQTSDYADPEPWGIINAAFKLTMVEGLAVDIGAYIPTDSEMNGGNIATVAVGGNYVMDTLTLHLAALVNLYDEDISGIADPGFTVGLGVEYGLADGPTIQGDFRYSNDIYSGMEDGQIDIGAFAKWSYSNGLWGIGIQMSTNNFTTGVIKEEVDAMAIVIPIRIEYWF